MQERVLIRRTVAPGAEEGGEKGPEGCACGYAANDGLLMISCCAFIIVVSLIFVSVSHSFYAEGKLEVSIGYTHFYAAHSKSWIFPGPLPIAICPVDSEIAHNGISSPSADVPFQRIKLPRNMDSLGVSYSQIHFPSRWGVVTFSWGLSSSSDDSVARGLLELRVKAITFRDMLPLFHSTQAPRIPADPRLRCETNPVLTDGVGVSDGGPEESSRRLKGTSIALILYFPIRSTLKDGETSFSNAKVTL